ncbi:MAG: hypothetical protein LBL75_02900 [Rickettsiales bacterium]|jgi:hypothetical protein|nr:hypothetical protein [Rickettsiales bacterium]
MFPGRPIIKTEFANKGIVFVGREQFIFNGITFHDFLIDFIKSKLGYKWLREQSLKPDANKHPILLWFAEIGNLQKSAKTNGRGLWQAPLSGSTTSLLKLAYYIYLLGNNAKIENLLLTRLRNKELFYAALYETYVASVFLYAGYNLELEDETDSTKTHCEFTAINRKTGNRYSVEAKLRSSNVNDIKDVKISNQLIRALKKQTDNQKIIFIDANYPLNSEKEMNTLFDNIEQQINLIECKQNQKDEAFLFITNNPYHFRNFTPSPQSSVLIRGFRKPDFNLIFQQISLHQMIDLRDKYQDILDIHAAFPNTLTTPDNFNGDIVDQIYKILPIKNKYQINNNYDITINNKNTNFTLNNYIIDYINKEVFLIFKNSEGTILHIESLTDDDIKNHKDAQQKMIDAIEQKNNRNKNLLELYDWLYSVYSNTSKDKLIEFMSNVIDMDILESKTQKELARIYCEGMAQQIYFHK